MRGELQVQHNESGMFSFSSLTVAALIALVITLIGVVISAFRRGRLFENYREIEADARQIARRLHAEILREQGDLVIRGNFGQLPTAVRFSQAENMPGVNLQMGAPASFNLQIVPRGSKQQEGRTTVRTGNELLDSRFVARTDHPTQVKLLLSAKGVASNLQRLCCSARTLFGLTPGNIELSELLIPAAEPGNHILNHLADMHELATSLEQIPGAHEVKIAKMHRERTSPAVRVALAAGVIAAAVALLAQMRPSSGKTVVPRAEAEMPAESVHPEDAALIPNLEGWRVARSEDLDGSAIAWLRGSGQPAEGRVTGDFSGNGSATDVAYILVNRDGVKRLVLIVNRQTRYDARYNYIGMAMCVPKAIVAQMKWVGTPPHDFEGDGLLITRQPEDPTSGLVIFASGKHIVSGVPANYQTIPLR